MRRRNVLKALILMLPSLVVAPALAIATPIKHDKKKAKAEVAKILEWLNKGDYTSFKAYGPVIVEVDKKELSDTETEKFFREFAPHRRSPKFKPARLGSFDRNTKNPPLIMYVAVVEQKSYLEKTCYEEDQELITFQENCEGPPGYQSASQFWYVYFKGEKIRLMEQLMVFS
jgi:hypothetical protein